MQLWYDGLTYKFTNDSIAFAVSYNNDWVYLIVRNIVDGRHTILAEYKRFNPSNKNWKVK